MHEILLTLFGASLAAAMMGCGVLLGRRITTKTIEAEVIKTKADLELKRQDLSRITEGIRQGWLDSAGQQVKLMTSSKLRSLTDGELEVIALDRGLLTMQRLGDRTALIAAIESQQRSWIQNPNLIGSIPEWRQRGNDIMAEAISRRTPEERRRLIDEGIIEEGEV